MRLALLCSSLEPFGRAGHGRPLVRVEPERWATVMMESRKAERKEALASRVRACGDSRTVVKRFFCDVSLEDDGMYARLCGLNRVRAPHAGQLPRCSMARLGVAGYEKDIKRDEFPVLAGCS